MSVMTIFFSFYRECMRQVAGNLLYCETTELCISDSFKYAIFDVVSYLAHCITFYIYNRNNNSNADVYKVHNVDLKS